MGIPNGTPPSQAEAMATPTGEGHEGIISSYIRFTPGVVFTRFIFSDQDLDLTSVFRILPTPPRSLTSPFQRGEYPRSLEAIATRSRLVFRPPP